MQSEYHRYAYDGPVFEHDRLVANHWKGETIAPSERKARSNLTYQYKVQNNRIPSIKATLPGKVVLIN